MTIAIRRGPVSVYTDFVSEIPNRSQLSIVSKRVSKVSSRQQMDSIFQKNLLVEDYIH